MKGWLKRRLPLAAGFFGALCLTGPQWGGSYEGAAVVDGILALIWALVRCYLAAALWTRTLDPALLGGRHSLWRLTPLALVWLVTTQCIASLGSLMPLAAEIWAGEPWLEAIYPHGQLIWTALSLAGWLPALLAAALWYRLRGGHVPGRRWAGTALGLLLWALALWGLRVTADALGLSDACLVALVLDGLSMAGPALLLADLATGLTPLSQAQIPARWSRLLGLLWAPAVWFFTQYGFALRMLEAVADYGAARDWLVMPLDILGDVAQGAALWLFAALCAARRRGIPLSRRDFWRCWPAAVVAVAAQLAHLACMFPLQEAIYAGEYQVLPCLGWVGVSLLGQTLGLACAIGVACALLHAKPVPYKRLLLLPVGLTLAELVVLLASYGLALHPAGFSFGMSLAVQLPYDRLIAFHGLVLAWAVGIRTNQERPALICVKESR